MRAGPTFPGGTWAQSPLRLFEGDRVQVQDEDGDWFAGTLDVVGSGLEVRYDEPRAIGGCVESSRFVSRDELQRSRCILRPETLWDETTHPRREDQIWFAAHPGWAERIRRWGLELIRKDPISAEPLLRRYLGRRVVVERQHGGRKLHACGLLLSYDSEFLALADATVPAETSLPLCPGRTAGANLEIDWNDDGLELFNRGRAAVTVLGIRTADGLDSWEFVLRPGFRERSSFRRQPAGTAELVFECPVKGDALLPRRAVRVRGGSEGTITLPALPELEPEPLLRERPRDAARVAATLSNP